MSQTPFEPDQVFQNDLAVKLIKKISIIGSNPHAQSEVADDVKKLLP